MNTFIKTKKAVLMMLVFIFGVIIFTSGNKVTAYDGYENVYDESGNVINYRGTTDPVLVSTKYKEKTTEFRAVWVSAFAGDVATYYNKTQMQQQLLSVLDTMETYHMNAIVYHIRTHNDALYKTDMDIPVSRFTQKCDFEEWDYLEWFIKECHERGIEFHAWLNPYRIFMGGGSKEAVIKKYKDNPTNPAHDLSNVLFNKSGDAILDPGIPKVRKYIIDVCMDIINNYDVDAIHFDDYFYIKGCDDSKTRQKYGDSSQSIADFRREQVDIFIHDLSQKMKGYNLANNRAVQLGISPSGIYRNGHYVAPHDYKYDSKGNLTYPLHSGTSGYSHYDLPLYCDTLHWINKEWIDYIVPQVYWSFAENAAAYAAIVQWWALAVKNKRVNLYIGTGLYKKERSAGDGWTFNEHELTQQLRYSSVYSSVKGFCIYQYRSLIMHRNSDDIKLLLKDYWTNTPKTPTLNRYYKSDMVTPKPVNINIYREKDCTSIEFNRVDSIYRYLVYRYKNDLKLNDSSQILGTYSYNDKGNVIINDITNEEYKYAIIAIDKLGGSSDPALIDLSSKKEFKKIAMEFNDIHFPSEVSPGDNLDIYFYPATIYYGGEAKYQLLSSDTQNGEYTLITEFKMGKDFLSGKVKINEEGTPIFVKIIATNQMGTITTKPHKIVVTTDTADSLLKTIENMIGEQIRKIIGD